MGPWSRSGVRIGQKERFEWKEVVRLDGVHERSVFSLDWKSGGIEGGLGRIASCGGDGKIRIWQVVSHDSTLILSRIARLRYWAFRLDRQVPNPPHHQF